jgi:hypothetical protein
VNDKAYAFILPNYHRAVNATEEKIRRLLQSPENQDIMLSVFSPE